MISIQSVTCEQLGLRALCLPNNTNHKYLLDRKDPRGRKVVATDRNGDLKQKEEKRRVKIDGENFKDMV